MENELDKKSTDPPRQKSKKWRMWLMAVIVIVLLAVMSYLWWLLQNCHNEKQTLEKEKQQLQSQIDTLAKQKVSTEDKKSEDAATACNDTPSTIMKENIKAALDTKNTAPFATYTSNPVKFVIAASEKGDNETPDQAAASMTYTHTATGPWDFNLPAATTAHYDAGFYTDYFDTTTYVGKAASGMVAAFDFDCNGKIKQIFIAADEELL